MGIIICVSLLLAFIILLAVYSGEPVEPKPKHTITITASIQPHVYTPEERAEEERKEYMRWQALADPVLNRLRISFLSLTRVNSRSGRPPEVVSAQLAECIDLWYAYLDTQDGIGAWVHAYDYLKENFGPGFEPCLTNSGQLKERLNTAAVLQQMGTVRIEAVTRELLQLISGRGPVRRCDLVKMPLASQSPEEVRAVIAELVRTGRLTQFKNGRYYYIASKNA